MGLVEEKAGELKDAIVNDEGYQKFLRIKGEVEQDKVLCDKINQFRWKNFELHMNLEGEELYNAMENFERENATFRKDPLVNEFLAAELRVVRTVQDAAKILLDAIDLDLVSNQDKEGDGQ